MRGFWFHQISLRRFRIMGRDMRTMRARLAMKRRVNKRVIQSLRASQVAVAEMEEENRRMREEMELMSEANTLTDLWVYDCLFEVENDPLMRNAFERINAQNLNSRNILHMDRARSFTGRCRRP